MDAALDKLRGESYPVNPEDLARLSPLVYQHINMQGRYSFTVPDALAKGELRPIIRKRMGDFLLDCLQKS